MLSFYCLRPTFGDRSRRAYRHLFRSLATAYSQICDLTSRWPSVKVYLILAGYNKTSSLDGSVLKMQVSSKESANSQVTTFQEFSDALERSDVGFFTNFDLPELLFIQPILKGPWRMGLCQSFNISDEMESLVKCQQTGTVSFWRSRKKSEKPSNDRLLTLEPLIIK